MLKGGAKSRQEFFKFFDRLAPKADPETLKTLKAEARRFFAAADDATISIMELDCADTECPGIETVIALLDAGQRPRVVRFQKPVVKIGPADFQTIVESGDRAKAGRSSPSSQS
ncbi:MAG: hypothetical protein R3D69_04795 [Xanthobacteraceae bacterium]